MDVLDVDKFVSKHLSLLELERDAEIEEKREYLQDFSAKDLQKRGVLLSRVQVGTHRTSLYGRCLCSFQSQWPGKDLPSHRVTPGDIVGVCEGDGTARKVLCSGVATQASHLKIKVAFENSWETLTLNQNTFYSLLKLANDVTYKRIKSALHQLQKAEYSSLPLVSVLFGEREPQVNSHETVLSDSQFINGNLNDEQRWAVNFALQQKEIGIVHGPPGTGKTTTLIEIILQSIARKIKVLVCAPSNVAVDNLVERLSAVKPVPRMVRLGHPARLLPHTLRYSLDALLEQSHQASLIDDIRKEIDAISRKEEDDGHLKAKEVYQQRALRKELSERERLAESELLKSMDLVLCTLTSSSVHGPLRHLDKDNFGLVVIDECSQAIEAACWIALLRAPKCIIAGDHLQLPPTIISEKAAAEGLSVSLMERLCSLLGEGSTRMLCTQYRMHQDIMTWASHQLYQDKLIAHHSVATHKLSDLPMVEDNEETSSVLLLVDTAGCQLWETEQEGDESKANPGEAAIVSVHVTKLVKSGLNPSEIAVITPYNLQVEFLRQHLSERFPSLEIQSVDGFQGREKEAVVISLVRSNDKREVGFLAESRRINVAVTRARRHLAVICDTGTVNANPFLLSLTEFLSSHGEVHSAHQYTQEMESLEHCVKPSQQLSSQKPTSVSKAKKLTAKVEKHASDETKSSFKETRSQRNADTNQKVSDEQRHLLFEKELLAFASNPQLEACSFSSELNSYERRIIHELSEKLGLIHVSNEDSSGRFIQVSKKKAQLNSEQDACENMTPKDTMQTNNIPKNSDQERSGSCKAGKGVHNKAADSNTTKDSDNLPSNAKGSNFTCKSEEHSSLNVQAGTQLDHVADQSIDKEDTTKPKNNSKKKKQKKKEVLMPAVEDDDDLDALLAATIHQDNTCSQPNCEVSIKLMSLTCIHCLKRWCFKHSLPEIHGCGEAAKSNARSQMGKTGPPKVDPIKRTHIKRSLDKNLAKMAQQRKHKTEQSKN